MPLESNDAWAPAEVGLFSEQARAVRRCGNNAGRRGRARTHLSLFLVKRRTGGKKKSRFIVHNITVIFIISPNNIYNSLVHTGSIICFERFFVFGIIFNGNLFSLDITCVCGSLVV